MNKPWSLEEALELVRAIQHEVTKFGYHIALAGGVLNVGASNNDLDLCFLPFNNPEKAPDDPDGLVKWLTTVWGKSSAIGDYNRDHELPFRGVQVRAVRRHPQVFQPWVDELEVIRAEPMADPQWMPQAHMRPEDRPEGFNWDIETTQLKPKPSSSYKYRLKFIRPDRDRIDVFIV